MLYQPDTMAAISTLAGHRYISQIKHTHHLHFFSVFQRNMAEPISAVVFYLHLFQKNTIMDEWLRSLWPRCPFRHPTNIVNAPKLIIKSKANNYAVTSSWTLQLSYETELCWNRSNTKEKNNDQQMKKAYSIKGTNFPPMVILQNDTIQWQLVAVEIQLWDKLFNWWITIYRTGVQSR